MSRWRACGDNRGVGAYDDRWRQMEAQGQWVHGEADLVCWFEPDSVLDAGCGTGRVALELDRRGIDVVGVDVDEEMLRAARGKAPHVRWIGADLVDAVVAEPDTGGGAVPGGSGVPGGGGVHGRSVVPGGGAVPGGGGVPGQRQAFDLVVMAGNVMIFVAEGTEAAVVANMAAHLRPGGRLVAGFQLGRSSMTLADYDRFAADAGLVREHRFATWERAVYAGGDYAVSVHCAG